jgi:hypothetical protein
LNTRHHQSQTPIRDRDTARVSSTTSRRRSTASGTALREIARGVGVNLAVVHGEVNAAETAIRQPS